MGTEGFEGENPALSITAKKEPSKEQVLVEVIDESLNELFSPRTREALYDHLERNYSIDRDDIPKHLEQFTSVLRSTFGLSGRTIERKIEKKYCEKIGRKFYQEADYALSEYVESEPKSMRTTVTQSPADANDGIVSNRPTSALSFSTTRQSASLTGTTVDLNSANLQDCWSKYYSSPQVKPGMCA